MTFNSNILPTIKIGSEQVINTNEPEFVAKLRKWAFITLASLVVIFAGWRIIVSFF